MPKTIMPRLLYPIIFFLALLIRLWFNFMDVHVNVAFASDAAEYLRVAQGLNKAIHLPFQFWSDALSTIRQYPQNSPESLGLQKQLVFLNELSRGSPIFPFYILFGFAVFGVTPTADHWSAPIAVQCLLTSFAVVLIAITASNLWNRKAGFAAGLLAVVYPGFIVNSGRLYSESLATFLVCAILAIMSVVGKEDVVRPSQSFLLGFCAAALQITRSVMTAVPAFLLPFVLICGRPRYKSLFLFLLGFALLFPPWLFLQRAAFGSASFFVNRSGHYNFYLGNDSDTLGWLTFPPPELLGVDDASVGKLFSLSYHRSPGKWWLLMLDKMPRLFAFSWNDFKVRIGCFGPDLQTIFHQFILALGAIGLIASLFDKKEIGDQRRKLVRLYIVALFAFHSIYFCFITMPRYALTAMPCVIIFAGAALANLVTSGRNKPALHAGLNCMAYGLLLVLLANLDLFNVLAREFQDSPLNLLYITQGMLRVFALGSFLYFARKFAFNVRSSRFAASCLAGIVFLTVLPSVAFPLRAYGRLGEWHESFDSAGEQISQQIAISEAVKVAISQRQSYILFNIKNGETLSREFAIDVNGVKLFGPFIPAMSVAQRLRLLTETGDRQIRSEAETILSDMVSSFSDLSPLALRDTYLVPFSPAEIDQAFSKKPDQLSLTVTFKKLIDSPNTIYGSFATSGGKLTIPSIDLFSWEKGSYAPEDKSDMGDCAYDTQITLQERTAPKNPISAPSGAKSKLPFSSSSFIRLLISPASASGNTLLKTVSSAPMVEVSAADADPEERVYNASTTLPDANRKRTVLVRMKGRLEGKGASGTCVLSLEAFLKKRDGSRLVYSSIWLPRRLVTKDSDGDLDYCFPIDLSAADATLSVISAKLSKVATDAGVLPELKRCEATVYELPNDPVGPGHEIH